MTVPAAPNKCVLTGTVVEIHRESDAPLRFNLMFEILQSEDIPNVPNFGKHHVGSIVPATTAEDLSSISAGQVVRCCAEYRGGPTGGVFRLFEIRPSTSTDGASNTEPG